MKFVARLIYLLVMCPFFGKTQDTLAVQLSKAANDTDKVRIYLDRGNISFRDKYEQTISEINIAIDIIRKHDNEKDEKLVRQYKALLIKAYTILGRTELLKARYDEGFAILEKAIPLAREINFKKGEAAVYNTLALGNSYAGNFVKSLEYYQRSLQLNEERKDTAGLISNYINMGLLYKDKEDFMKAKEYYNKVIAIANKKKHSELLASCYNNLGNIYGRENQHRKALSYFFLALPIKERSASKNGLATTYGNIGSEYVSLKMEDSTLYWTNKSIALNEEIESWEGLASDYNTMAFVYESLNDLSKAEKYARLSLQYARKVGPTQLKHAEKKMYDILFMERKFEEANLHLVRYYSIRDSLINIDVDKKIAQKEIGFEFEKKEAILKAEQQKQQAISDEENKRQRIIIIFVSLVIVLMAVFSVTLFNRFKLIKKQNLVIEAQKAEVEIKQKEILDSINYAKRIQFALLASNNLLNAHLPEHFIVFKPKDVVSGDFYWATPTTDGFIYITADCTGHGVPGAFMSLLNISKLSQTINENKITRPDLILNNVRDEIVKALNAEGTESNKDGMDAVLCKLDVKNKKLEYAAANNSFYIIRNNGSEKEVIVCKADKMPVGKYHDEIRPFSYKQIDLKKGDVIYTFTDGFADQFGGAKGKKYKSKNLEELLLAHSHESMASQKEKIVAAFENWRGKLEQIDDVCVIGVRI